MQMLTISDSCNKMRCDARVQAGLYAPQVCNTASAAISIFKLTLVVQHLSEIYVVCSGGVGKIHIARFTRTIGRPMATTVTIVVAVIAIHFRETAKQRYTIGDDHRTRNDVVI